MIKHIPIVLFIFILFSNTKGNCQSISLTPEEQEWLNNHQTIEFGYEPNWGPYEIYENGTYTGIVGAYIQIIEEKLGIDMIPIPDITWKESFSKLKNGDIHIVPCCAITAERQKFLSYTTPYINDPLVIVTRKNYAYISGFNDLIGHTISLPKHYYSTELITRDYPNLNILEKKDVQACLEDVSNGTSDAFIGSLGIISYHLNHKGFTTLKIAAPTPYENNGFAFAVTKDWTIFKDIIQKVLNSITPFEERKLRQDWISNRFDYYLPWNTTLVWILSITLIFFVIILIIVKWNRSLKKQIILRQKGEIKLKNSLEKIKKQDQEKETLLQEIHHRVKNNLQIIISLLRLQSNSNNDSNVKKSLSHATERIRAISLIHEKIYSSSNMAEVGIQDYVLSLGNEIINSVSSLPVKLEVKSSIQNLNLKSFVPLALILNELFTNSIKYGLKDKNEGIINIDFHRNENLTLRYFDNGTWVDNDTSDYFGSTLIDIFTEQLEGDYILNKNKFGTEYIFNFKEFT